MTNEQIDSKTWFAAQNAREGLINVLDLSLLTGIPTAQLTGLAKKGLLASYDEYHGKRFFKFQEVVNWFVSLEPRDEWEKNVASTVENLMKHPECPYVVERVMDESGTASGRIRWKDMPQAA